jgi:hypothetical protein
MTGMQLHNLLTLNIEFTSGSEVEMSDVNVMTNFLLMVYLIAPHCRIKNLPVCVPIYQ